MKAINNPIIVILAVILINLSACSPVFYSTVGQNVPLFREKGEVTLNAGLAISGNNNDSATGLNAQLAVAIDSSLAIMSSFYSLNEDGAGNGKYFELGVGKFSYSSNTKLTGEIFFGSGFGSITNYLENQDIRSNFLKVFIQPSGGFSSKIIDIAFTPRIGLVQYVSHTNIENDRVIERFFSEKNTTVVFEPGVTVRLGFKDVKIQYQFNYSSFDFNGNGELEPVYNQFNSFNIFFLVSHRWDKMKKAAKKF